MDYDKKPGLLLSGSEDAAVHQGNIIRLDPPPAGSFFYTAWNYNKALFEDIKNTEFIQEMSASTLNPSKYGPFGIHYILCCFKFTKALERAKKRVDHSKDPELIIIIDTMIRAFTAFSKWHFDNEDSIIGTYNYANYTYLVEYIGEDASIDPIYTVAALLPHFHIRYELSQYLLPNRDKTLYKSWIDANSSPDTAYAIGNFISTWIENRKPFNLSQALDFYDKDFYYEYVGYHEAIRYAFMDYALKHS